MEGYSHGGAEGAALSDTSSDPSPVPLPHPCELVVDLSSSGEGAEARRVGAAVALLVAGEAEGSGRELAAANEREAEEAGTARWDGHGGALRRGRSWARLVPVPDEERQREVRQKEGEGKEERARGRPA